MKSHTIGLGKIEKGENMKKFKLNVTETLSKECEVEAETEEQAIKELKRKYRDCEIVLDDKDLVCTDFETCGYKESEQKILKQITDFCANECGECTCCPEGECVLYRIQKIIEDGFYEG